MVTTTSRRAASYTATSALVRLYLVVVAATLVALALLTLSGSNPPASAWIHVAIVAWFAILLPLRLRSARQGSARGHWAVAIIATVSLAANVAEALLPGLFPIWMRVEMVGIAVLMLAIVGTDLARR